MSAPIGKPTLDEAALDEMNDRLRWVRMNDREAFSRVLTQARLALALEAENARLTRELENARVSASAWRERCAAAEAEVLEAREALARVMSVTLQHEPMDLTAQGWLGGARAFLSRPSSTAALAAFGERCAKDGWIMGATNACEDASTYANMSGGEWEQAGVDAAAAIVARELGRTVTE